MSDEKNTEQTDWVDRLRVRYVAAAFVVFALISAAIWMRHHQLRQFDEDLGNVKIHEGDVRAANLLARFKRMKDEIVALDSFLTLILGSVVVAVFASFVLIFEPVARLINRVIHQREEAMQVAQEASEHKSQFLANMSHEIRTPMNGIIGMGDLLASTRLEADQREYLHLMQQSTDALLRILNDILDFSKIEAGKLEFDPIPFSLRDCVESTAQAYSSCASEKGIELLCRVKPTIPDVLIGDSGRLQQVIANLIGNAIKFTDRGGVFLNVEQAPMPGASQAVGDHPEKIALKFIVKDTGIGIPPEKQESIFGAFSQADASTTRKHGGTGLGLAICTQLVQMMDGKMSVESEVGRGTTFFFTAVLGVEAKPREPAELAGLRGMSVLVVDDNDTNRRILQETLKNWKMKPVMADSGVTAVQKVKQSIEIGDPIQLILMDCMMPGMDGFEVAERLNRIPSEERFRMVMMSSSIRPGDTERCRDLGFARCLPKPVKHSELQKTILNLFGLEAKPSKVEDLKTTVDPRRILLVEDNPINQRVAMGLLSRHSHDVVIANDGEQAVERVMQEEFDLILMDVQLPRMDGYAATQAIRDLGSPKSRTPIIAMTGNAMKGDRERCLEAGMDGYLAKPIDQAKLLSAVESVPAAVNAAQPHSPRLPLDVDSRESANESQSNGATRRLIDWQIVHERVPGGDEVVRDIAAMLQTQAPSLIEEIEASRDREDTESMGRAAHTLKGSVSIFGADEIVKVANRLESLARAGEFDDADLFLGKLKSLIPDLLDEISDYLHQTEPAQH